MNKSSSTISFVSSTNSLPNSDSIDSCSEYKYESLKELLASSPTNYSPLITCTCDGTDEIPNIRNRLVQKAACSYLKSAMPAIKRPSQNCLHKCVFLLMLEKLSNDLIKRPVKFISKISQDIVDLVSVKR